MAKTLLPRSFVVALALAPAALGLGAGLQPHSAVALTPAALQSPPPAETLSGVERRLIEEPRLQRLYETWSYLPLWLEPGRNGLSGRGQAVVQALADAEREGLDPASYLVAEIESARSAGRWQELDLLISAGLLRYVDDMVYGRKALRAQGEALADAETPLDPVAEVASLAGAAEPAARLAALAPDHPQYARLRDLLARLRARAEAGGWPRVPEGDTLDPGMRDPRVPALRARLAAGEAEAAGAALPVAEAELYDQALEQRVRAFQQRHGLAVDGRVGPNTLAALNRSAAELAEIVQANLERWRWLPRTLGPRYILVNTAGYELQAVDRGERALTMRVISGMPSRETPMFSARMSYLEVNPTWTVPPTIFAKDYLPKLREDPGYLAKQHITLYASWSPSATPVDPYTVDWHAVRASSRHLPYRLVQSPGPHNALGRIKFMMPNKYSIYLHDTPHRELFSRSRRALSSGCVRVARPDDLARLLLPDAPGWDMARLEAAYADGGTRRIDLDRSWPVHVTYFTAWVDDSGATHFFDDVYGRDAELLGELRSRQLLVAEEPRQAAGRS